MSALTSVSTSQADQHKVEYEKYIVEKRESPEKKGMYTYLLSRVDSTGNAIETFSEEESLKKLRSEFFKGSVLLCRNPEMNSFLHKVIHFIQKYNSLLFRRHKNYDYSLTHAAIVLDKGTRTPEQYPIAPFTVAHADYPGLVKENYDFLMDKDCTSLILYRPVSHKTRTLFLKYANQTAYLLKSTENYPNEVSKRVKKIKSSAAQRAKYSFLRGSGSLFWRTVFAPSGKTPKKTLDESLVRQTSFLIADLLLKYQILTKRGRVRDFICSGYAADVLSGAIMILSLKENCTSEQIRKFKRDSNNIPLTRSALAKKISKAILKKDPTDPVEKAFHDTYTAVKMTRVSATGQVLPIHLARELDKSVVDSDNS